MEPLSKRVRTERNTESFNLKVAAWAWACFDLHQICTAVQEYVFIEENKVRSTGGDQILILDAFLSQWYKITKNGIILHFLH